MPLGNRIIVLGCPGSGKSTFSRKLHKITGLPLIHLDNVWWKADRTHITREAFDRKLGEILAGDSWIIDGDYSRTYEARFGASDTVIFLDYGEQTCLKAVGERRGTEREDIPWVETEPDPALIALIKNYRKDNRPVILSLMERYPDKTAIVFQAREEADLWLRDMQLCRKGTEE